MVKYYNIYLFDWGVWRCAPLEDVWQNITLPSVQACHEEPHAPTGGREAVTHRGMGGTASAQPIHTHERWAGPSSLGSCSGQEVARAVRCRQAGLATPASETAPAWMGAVWIAKGQARSRQGCLGRHPDISSMGGVALAHYQSFLLLTHSGLRRHLAGLGW